MKSHPRQQWLEPALPEVLGNADFTQRSALIARIDTLLVTSGIERRFVEHLLGLALTEHPGLDAQQRAVIEHRAEQALRCSLLRRIVGDSLRNMAILIAGMPIYQHFCRVQRFPVVRAPSKSVLARYERAVTPEFLQALNILLAQAATGNASTAALHLERPLDLDLFLVDSTCLELNIHFPVDWILLRDAVRTLVKAIICLRNHGLRHRMPDPENFICQMNNRCIAMTHAGKADGPHVRKRILRQMKRLTRCVEAHARTYRDAIQHHRDRTDLTLPQAERIIARIEAVLRQLPEAIRQAHERIIGERLVPSDQKILSLYEANAHVLVRGKAGSQVEFGNTLLLCEQRQGFIVDYDFFRERAPADAQLVPAIISRLRQIFPALCVNQGKPAFGADRGFHATRNATVIECSFFNAVASKSPAELRQQLKSKRFVATQKRRAQTEARVSIIKRNFIGEPIRAKTFEHQAVLVAWAILAHNLWVLARQPLAKQKAKAA